MRLHVPEWEMRYLLEVEVFFFGQHVVHDEATGQPLPFFVIFSDKFARFFAYP